MKATDSTSLIVVAMRTSMVLPSPKFCTYMLRPLPKFGDIASPATNIAAAAATAANVATAATAAQLYIISLQLYIIRCLYPGYL